MASSGIARPGAKVPGFARIDYLAPNPLGRSRHLTLFPDGRFVLRDVVRTAGGVREQRWTLRALPETVAAIAASLTGLRALPEALSRTGIPGESLVELRVAPDAGTDDVPWRRSKWLGDHVAGFDAPEALLTALARGASQRASPEYDGPPTAP